MNSTPTERHLQSIVAIGRQQLGRHAWHELEPALAMSWEVLREEDTPAWGEVAELVRSRCTRTWPT